MAGRGWARLWTLALFVLSAALLGGCGKDEGTANKQAQEKMPGREFSSNLPFVVWVQVEEGGPVKDAGQTPNTGKEPLTIPSCYRWWVELRGRLDMPVVTAELDAQKIPGLQFPPFASDEDLLGLKGLKGLQTLILPGAQVTDDGLAYLKELKGLQELRIGSTQVTDAGLAHLKELKALRHLVLLQTKVTDAGVAELKKSLPQLRVDR